MIKFPSLQNAGLISLDVETYDPDLTTHGPGAHRDGYIVGVSIGTDKGYREYFPVKHKGGGNVCTPETLFKWLRKELATPIPKVGAKLIYDLSFLRAAGVKVCGPFYDVQIAEPLIDENQFSFSLESLAKKYLNETKKSEELQKWVQENFKVRKPAAYIWQVPGDKVRTYGIGDADLPLRIFAKQKVILEKLDLWFLFLMECRLIPLLLHMRENGVRINTKRAEKVYDDLNTRYAVIVKQIKRASGIVLEPWNAGCISRIFDKLELPYGLTAKTQKPSFTKGWLEQHEHPVAKLITQARGLDKLKETFVKGVLLDNPTGDRIHCEFNQLKGDGGGTIARFSSSKPNLQQIPVRTAEGKLIRECFVPEKGEQWFCNDWSQIEFRLMANDAVELDLPGANDIMRAYLEDPNTDFHSFVAKLAGIDRYRAKTVNFGIAYGQGLAALASQLGVSVETARTLKRDYHAKVKFMHPLMSYFKFEAEENHQIRTRMNRIRRFDMWEFEHPETKKIEYFREHVAGSELAFTYRALNARIQGSAADIMKKAMVDIWESGVCSDVRLTMTIHDELDGSFDPGCRKANAALQEIKRIMETCEETLIPMRVDDGTGKNWDAAKG